MKVWQNVVFIISIVIKNLGWSKQHSFLRNCPHGQRVSPLLKENQGETYLSRCSRLEDEEWSQINVLSDSHVWSDAKIEAIHEILQRRNKSRADKEIPKVYIYPFPPEFNKTSFWNTTQNERRSYFEAAFSSLGHTKLAQETFYTYTSSTRIEMRWQPSNTLSAIALDNQHLLGVQIHRAILESKFIVNEPAEADLFFIPHYHLHTNKGAGIDFCSLVMPLWVQMLKDSTYFTRHNGKDHFIVSGRGLHQITPQKIAKEWTNDFYLNYDRVRGNADCQHFALEPMLRQVSILMPEAQCPFSRAHARTYPVPYASNSLSTFLAARRKLAEEKDVAASFYNLFHPKRKRLYTVSIAIKAGAITRGSNDAHQRVPFRSTLQKQCTKWAKCHVIPFASLDLNPDRLVDARDTYANSSFCLQPPGLSAARKGIIDSLILGCLPVLFRNDSMLGTTSPMTLSPLKKHLLFDPLDQNDLWPWHWSWWNAASITLQISQVENKGINALIKEIPSSQVTLARRVIQTYMPQLLWNIPDYNKGGRRFISEYLHQYAKPTALEHTLRQLKGLLVVDCCTNKLISHAPHTKKAKHKFSHSSSTV